MRLEQILRPKCRVKKGNEGDQAALPLFAARALSILLSDAKRQRRIGSMSFYCSSTTRWFNEVGPGRPFPFQKPGLPNHVAHRESEFRKGMSSILQEVIRGFVAQDRTTAMLIEELNAAADRYLADFVLLSLGRDAEMTSNEVVWSFCLELRTSLSVARLLTLEGFTDFLERGPTLHPHERHLQLAGRIARELIA